MTALLVVLVVVLLVVGVALIREARRNRGA